MEKLLTIVVPVYNVEKYICKCLDSCIIYKEDDTLDEEKMNQLEVIIVNDGTPDRSAELSREYTVRYPQTFRQIDQENRGHGGAWNHGLKEATGKYLRFLDSDDWLTNLDKLMEKLERCDADMVFTQLDKFYVKNEEYVRFPINDDYGKMKNVNDFHYDTGGDYTLCDFQYCTYKTEILKPLHPLFDEKILYDDMILFVAPQMLSNTYIVFDFVLYNYLVGRPGQTMDPDVQKKNNVFIIKEYKKMLDFYQLYMPQSKTKEWAAYAIICHISNHFVSKLPNLPYRESKIKAIKLKTDILSFDNVRINKQTKRLIKYPFWVFYILEQIRKMKNRE